MHHILTIYIKNTLDGILKLVGVDCMYGNPTTIKFLHPGPERKLTKTEIINKFANWQTEPSEHSRKYFEVKGEYISSLNFSIKSDEIGFWGEWEAESQIIRTLNPSLSTLPHFVHKPVKPLSTPRIPGKRFLNTDPCVFGDDFLYSNCRQRTFKSLQNLNIGDVIIFGSSINGDFVVDTVFVVGKIIKFNRRNQQVTIGNSVASWYYHSTLNLLADNYILYFGATYYNQIDGMFSFFPCSPTKRHPNGFSRPKTFHKYNGKKALGIAYRELDQPNREWIKVVNDVLNNGLCLGIKANI